MNRYDICEAHALLENDFNVGGILRERPSNARRNQSTGVQLHRMKYHNHGSGYFDDLSDDGKEIYLINVVKWKLPMDDNIKDNIRSVFSTDWIIKNCPQVMEKNKSAAVKKP